MPLGVMPRNIWLEQRKEELYEAIKRYVLAGVLNDSVEKWHKEHDLISKELEVSDSGDYVLGEIKEVEVEGSKGKVVFVQDLQIDAKEVSEALKKASDNAKRAFS